MANNVKNPPLFDESCSYENWEKAIKLWQLVTDLNACQQGPAVALSLSGKAKEAILELSIDQLNSDNGVEEILLKLGKIYKKDSVDTAYEAFESFISFQRRPSSDISKYITEFERRYNKAKQHGCELSSSIQACFLLNQARLSSDHKKLVRATLSGLEIEEMKTKLKKVFGSSGSSVQDEIGAASIKVEELDLADEGEEVEDILYGRFQPGFYDKEIYCKATMSSKNLKGCHHETCQKEFCSKYNHNEGFDNVASSRFKVSNSKEYKGELKTVSSGFDNVASSQFKVDNSDEYEAGLQDISAPSSQTQIFLDSQNEVKIEPTQFETVLIPPHSSEALEDEGGSDSKKQAIDKVTDWIQSGLYLHNLLQFHSIFSVNDGSSLLYEECAKKILEKGEIKSILNIPTNEIPHTYKESEKDVPSEKKTITKKESKKKLHKRNKSCKLKKYEKKLPIGEKTFLPEENNKQLLDEKKTYTSGKCGKNVPDNERPRRQRTKKFPYGDEFILQDNFEVKVSKKRRKAECKKFVNEIVTEPSTVEIPVVHKESEKLLPTKELEKNQSISSIEGKLFSCEQCDKKFLKRKSLTAHRKTHSTERPFACKICGKTFSIKGRLKCHMFVHTGEKPFSCTYCGKRFAKSSTLKSHLRTHTGEKPHECLECGRKFAEKSSLKVHMFTHTGEGYGTSIRELSFVCQICGKCFSRRGTLRDHMYTHTDDKPYKCELCGKSFLRKGDLDAHISMHTGDKKFPCEHCGKRFHKKNKLVSHMRVHATVKPYNCDECGKGFHEARHLRLHKEAHTGYRPYYCEECGKGFSSKANLTYHMEHRVCPRKRMYTVKVKKTSSKQPLEGIKIEDENIPDIPVETIVKPFYQDEYLDKDIPDDSATPSLSKLSEDIENADKNISNNV